MAIEKEAEIKSAPRKNSKTLKLVNYDILKLAPPGMIKNWYIVQLKEKKIGYIHNSKARSSVGHRAYFKKINGKWKLTTFVAGD